MKRHLFSAISLAVELNISCMENCIFTDFAHFFLLGCQSLLIRSRVFTLMILIVCPNGYPHIICCKLFNDLIVEDFFLLFWPHRASCGILVP